MVLTIKRIMRAGIVFRFRPVLKIAQNDKNILREIRDYLGIGTIVVSDDRCNCLQINGNKAVIKFASIVGPHLVLKKSQVLKLRELAEFQIEHTRQGYPYSRKDIERIIDLRDQVYKANSWSRARIKQKYPREVVMKEHAFVDIEQWENSRTRNWLKAVQGKTARASNGQYYALIKSGRHCGQK